MAFDNKYIALAVGKTSGVTLLDFYTGADLWNLGNSDIFNMDFNDEGKLLAFNYADYMVTWDLNEQKVGRVIFDSTITGGAFNFNRNVLSIAGSDGAVRQLDLHRSEWRNHIALPGGKVMSLKGCGDRYVVTGHWYDTMNVLDVVTGQAIRTHHGNK